ncbi:MAG: hypothetical protein KDE33_14655 [Bacteroidetes bacterium]|nr:hypothetical protein [Bacteroidota bacterium]
MKKNIVAVLLVLVPIISICPEDSKSSSGNFELSVSRQYANYHPHQYETTKSVYYPYSLLNGKLERNNEKFTSVLLGYNNDSIRIEFSYFELDLHNPTFTNVANITNAIWIQDIPIYIDSRSETQANVFYLLKPLEDLQIALGGGIHRIQTKYDYSSPAYSYNRRDLVDTYGPQVGLKTNYKISDNFELFLNYMYLYTRGHRNYEYAYALNTTTGPFFYHESQSHGTIAEFFGHDYDLGIGYKLTTTAKIRFGYQAEMLKFRYKNYYINASDYNRMFRTNLYSSSYQDWKNDEVSGAFLELNVLF